MSQDITPSKLAIPSIHELVRKQERNYIIGNTKISKYVNFCMYENIERIDAYLNSKHISGEKDSQGRDKPFFNIVTAAVNIWYRATDIDRKDIKVKATKASDTLGAFLLTIHLQEWMRKQRFGVVLNEWGRSLARYGSSVLKFVEKKDGLHIDVMPWNRLIVDSVDFNNNVKVEILELTPAQLKKRKGYDQDVVNNVLDTIKARELINKQKVDNKNDYIKLYEVHGELPLSMLTDDVKDNDTYVQQMHVITFVLKGNARGRGVKEYDNFTLVKGREAKDPYMITHLIKEDGRTQAIGAVEYLFDAQWMQNHTTKQIKDQLDLASKIIFQTADASFIGTNALNAIENGDILIHKENQPITEVANTSHDITAIQAYANQWKALGQELTSTPDALQGNTPPSGIAYKTQQAVQAEAHSLFEIMIENKSLAIEDMMREYILPSLRRKLDHSKEISATLDEQGITKVDLMYVNNEAIRRTNKKIADQIFNNQIAQPADVEGEKSNIRGSMAPLGNQRFFAPSDIGDTTWKELFKDLEDNVEVDASGEASNKSEILTTLTNVLQTIATNPQVLQDPNARMIFNKILQATGDISPIELVAPQQQKDSGSGKNISESMNYKDLSPELQAQMAAKAGFTPTPNSQALPASPTGGR